MSEGTWLTLLMILLILIVGLAFVGLASEAVGGINESGLIDR